MASYQEVLTRKFGEGAFPTSQFRDNTRIHVPAERLLEVMAALKADAGFDMLLDVAGIDYLQYPNATDRYGLVYALTSTATGERLFVKVGLNDPDPRVASVNGLWKAANWLEREVFDLLGVHFDGHPDLRRILMPPEFAGFPLRKDYPLRGRGERHNFETVTRAES